LFSTKGGSWADPAVIVSDAVLASVEGLTLVGGEPFDQADACADLAAYAQEAGLGVICFTGYSAESLISTSARRLLDSVDLLVDGPYLADSPESQRSLVGSTNQRFVHLSSRYQDFDPARTRNRLEIRVSADGTIEAAGFLDKTELDRLASALPARRDLRISRSRRSVREATS
jgi:anaerobic ribonucleoside-triphosphate reductase activating protein